MEVLIGIAALLVLGVYVVVKRGFEVKKLAEHGVTTTGTIEKKWKHTGSGGRSTKRLRYGFRDRNGRAYGRAIIASESEFESLAVGDPVKVVYLPANPKTNALESMVEIVRQALEKKKSGVSP